MTNLESVFIGARSFQNLESFSLSHNPKLKTFTTGDCDFDDIVAWWNNSQLTEKRYITPVPNGVGPMTVYSLIRNVNSAYTINLFYGMAKDRGSN